MTVIGSDGIDIAADGMMIRGQSEIAQLCAKKIRVDRDRNVIFALTGSWGMFDALVKWYWDGKDAKSIPVSGGDVAWTLIVIDRKGPVKFNHSVPYPEPIEYPMTWGFGADYAMGALLAGVSAKRAIEIACMKDAFCGGEIQVINIAEALGLPHEGKIANGRHEAADMSAVTP